MDLNISMISLFLKKLIVLPLRNLNYRKKEIIPVLGCLWSYISILKTMLQ